jgi:hypothetical protein
MSATPKKRALVLRPFNDAGTQKKFKKDDQPLIEAGSFANFKTAGLVIEAPAAKAPRASKPKAAAKPKARKAAAKPAPASAPAAPVDDTAPT